MRKAPPQIVGERNNAAIFFAADSGHQQRFAAKPARTGGAREMVAVARRTDTATRPSRRRHRLPGLTWPLFAARK